MSCKQLASLQLCSALTPLCTSVASCSVNNAGYGLSGVLESLDEEQIRRQIDVNFFGVVDVTRKAIATMRELKTGGLVQQVSSIGGLQGYPAYSIYSA